MPFLMFALMLSVFQTCGIIFVLLRQESPPQKKCNYIPTSDAPTNGECFHIETMPGGLPTGAVVGSAGAPARPSDVLLSTTPMFKSIGMRDPNYREDKK